MRIFIPIVALLILCALPARAQIEPNVPAPVPGAKPVTLERIKIHATALEGNLEGDPVDRDVLVFLPPSYATESDRHYPVVYALHSFFIGAEQFSQTTHLQQMIEGAFAKGAKEMIVVLPDSMSIYAGSMYSSSVTTGDVEQYIARDVVTYIDAHYRTIPDRASRGLAGHSMGGYGAARIGIKHPDVFSSLYIMSACCLSAPGEEAVKPPVAKSLEAIKTPAEATSLGSLVRARMAFAAAWSPNPKNPPFYFDLPTKKGVLQPDVFAKWAANAPLVFIDQYIDNLRMYRAIAIDVGDQDPLRPDSIKLHDVLASYGIADSFEIYHGDHGSALPDRLQNHVIPFFSQNLCFSDDCQSKTPAPCSTCAQAPPAPPQVALPPAPDSK
jgi:S-formylglutathione hydrolase FrmB